VLRPSDAAPGVHRQSATGLPSPDPSARPARTSVPEPIVDHPDGLDPEHEALLGDPDVLADPDRMGRLGLTTVPRRDG
jgi:hypothetical protein